MANEQKREMKRSEALWMAYNAMSKVVEKAEIDSLVNHESCVYKTLLDEANEATKIILNMYYDEIDKENEVKNG